MSFLEGVHQYQTNTSPNTQASGSVRETAAVRPAAQFQELTPGRVFEGMVTDIKNGQVTLGLSDGRTISARMESGVNLEKGQPMLFEVKSSTGEQIAIHPVTLESEQNPTLIKALEAAGLKITPRNLSMVNQMMMEQLPIDKNSLMQMARAASSFPQADMQVLVQMQKMGMAITENSLNQFQNYQNGQQAILPDMRSLMEGLANLPEQILGNEGGFGENFVVNPGGQNPGIGQMLGFGQQVMEILLAGGSQTEIQGGENAAVQNPEGAGQGVQNPESAGQGVQNPESPGQSVQNGGLQTPEGVSLTLQGEGAQNPENIGQTVNPEGTGQSVQNPELANLALQNSNESQTVSNAKSASPEIQGSVQQNPEGAGSNPIEQVLTREQQENFTSLLQKFSGAVKNEQLLPEGRLNTSLSAEEMLRQVMGALENSEGLKESDVKQLFASKEFKNLMKQAMTEQWLLTPEKLKEEGAVKELYQRLSRQMTELQQALSQAGKEGGTLAKTAQSVRSNLEFMNQLNQMYTYVQLPLKLHQQNAHSDLYVYTNKKNLRDKEGALSALLHLDLEHLGSTDIYVKMQGSNIQTDFYLTDELSYRLITDFRDELVKRLEQKGYNCEIKVENRKVQQNSVQDFLEQEKPAGKLHRYSFDVKA